MIYKTTDLDTWISDTWNEQENKVFINNLVLALIQEQNHLKKSFTPEGAKGNQH